MSWPIAFLAVPGIVEGNGESGWAPACRYLFRCVGLGLLWAAVSATWNTRSSKGRRGGLASAPRPPAR